MLRIASFVFLFLTICLWGILGAGGISSAWAIEFGVCNNDHKVLDGDWDYVNQVIEYLSNSNVKSIRASFPCAGYIDLVVHGVDPELGQQQLDNFAIFLDLCNDAEISVIFRLGYGSEFHFTNTYSETGCVTYPPSSGIRYLMPPQDEYWRLYVAEMVSRFGQEVDGFEVWNEPDEIGNEGDPNEPEPHGFFYGRVDDYMHLFRLAHEEVKAIFPDAPVAIGGLACKPQVFRSYLERLLERTDEQPVSIYDLCDAVGLHVYSDEGLRILRTYYEICESHDYVPKPVWVTEFARQLDEVTDRQYTLQGARAFPENIMETFESYGVTRAFWYTLTCEDCSVHLFYIDDDDILQDADNKWTYYSRAAAKHEDFLLSDMAGFGYSDGGRPLWGISPYEEYSAATGNPGYPVEHQSAFVFGNPENETPLESHEHNGQVLPIAFDINDKWVEELQGRPLTLIAEIESTGQSIELRYESAGEHDFRTTEFDTDYWDNLICAAFLDGLTIESGGPDYRNGVNYDYTTIRQLPLVPGQLTTVEVVIDDWTFQNGMTKRADISFVPVGNEEFKIHRLRLYPVPDEGGRVEFADKSSDTQLQYDGQPLNAVVLDYNNDGRKDLFVTRVTGNGAGLVEQCQGIVENSGVPWFQDQSLTVFDARPPSDTQGLIVADYDNDGWTDIFAPHPQGYTLYHNTGGAYADSTVTAGLDGAYISSVGGSWADYDSDGDLDLLVMVKDDPNYMSEGARAQRLFRNDLKPGETCRFVDVTEATGLDELQSWGFTALWADFDENGSQDLIMMQAMETPGSPSSGEWSRYLVLQADGTFSDVTAARLPGHVEWWNCMYGYAATADVNLDGHLDIVFASGGCRGYFENDGTGSFPTWNVQLSDNEGTDLDVLDYDLDGRPDLLLSRYFQPKLYANRISGGVPTFVDETTQVSLDDQAILQGTAPADFNGDGFTDLYLTRTDAGSFFYKADYIPNQLAKNWIGIRLESPYGANNRDGIGTTVTVTAGVKIQSQLVDGGSGRAGQHEADLVFGLGYYTGPVTVAVHWPTGRTQVESFHTNDLDNYLTISDDSPVVDRTTISLGFIYHLASGTQDWTISWETFNDSARDADKIIFDLVGVDERCWPPYEVLTSELDPEDVLVAEPASLGNDKWTHKVTLYDVPCESRCIVPYTIESGVSDYTSSESGYTVKVNFCLLTN